MNKLLKRIWLYLRPGQRTTGVEAFRSNDTMVDYSTSSLDYSYTESAAQILNESESFGGFNEGNFGGAGAGDSWSYSSSDNSGDSDGDSGGDSGSDSGSD